MSSIQNHLCSQCSETSRRLKLIKWLQVSFLSCWIFQGPQTEDYGYIRVQVRQVSFSSKEMAHLRDYSENRGHLPEGLTSVLVPAGE